MPPTKADRLIASIVKRVDNLEKRHGLLVQIVKDLAIKIYPPEMVDEKLREAFGDNPSLLEAYDKAIGTDKE
jgi:hypothetical protein